MEGVKKYSKKREAILEVLRSTKEHPSADWIYAQLKPQMPDLSLGTVYRNLAMFKREDQIMSVGTVNGQERFDGNTEPHAHFVCNRCGKVLDLEQIPVSEELLRAAQETLQADIISHELIFRGYCKDCKSPH